MNVMSKEYFEYIKKAYTKVDVDKYYSRYLIVDIEKNSCILDIGCGIGLFLQKLNTTIDNAFIVGIDVNMYALDYAHRIAPSAHLIRAVADKLPFLKKKFNAIFALDLIEHLKNPSDFLKEAHRVLSDSGSLTLSTPDRYSIYLVGGKSRVKQVVFIVSRILGFAKVDPTHVKEFTLHELSKLLYMNKFVLIKSDGYRARFVPPHRMKSLLVCCRKEKTEGNRDT